MLLRWQWRYECHNGNLLSKTASTLMDRWADEECLKKSEHPRLMHMMLTWICQKSIDFASTFFNQNSVIQRVRKRIYFVNYRWLWLSWKQTIKTLARFPIRRDVYHYNNSWVCDSYSELRWWDFFFAPFLTRHIGIFIILGIKTTWHLDTCGILWVQCEAPGHDS